MLDAITVFVDYLPPNTTPADIEIKYAYKCADGSGGWAGLSRTKGSPEKWRQALKASTCELGVFHISSMPAENIRRVFPYSSQAAEDGTVTAGTRARVSVKFNGGQIVFDAPPTLAVSYFRPRGFVIILNSSIVRTVLLLSMLPFLKLSVKKLTVVRASGSGTTVGSRYLATSHFISIQHTECRIRWMKRNITR